MAERMPVVEKLAKEAGQKGEQALQEQMVALKSAADSQNRKAVGETMQLSIS